MRSQSDRPPGVEVARSERGVFYDGGGGAGCGLYVYRRTDGSTPDVSWLKPSPTYKGKVVIKPKPRRKKATK